jgi:glycosyltransferase involved in cell wall biosynthesis
MANGLPVIATKVGSIPNYLDQTNSVLIEPKDSKAIYAAIVKIIEQQDFRKNLIKQGQLLSKENTLEQQTKKLINILNHVASS